MCLTLIGSTSKVHRQNPVDISFSWNLMAISRTDKIDGKDSKEYRQKFPVQNDWIGRPRSFENARLQQNTIPEGEKTAVGVAGATILINRSYSCKETGPGKDCGFCRCLTRYWIWHETDSSNCSFWKTLYRGASVWKSWTSGRRDGRYGLKPDVLATRVEVSTNKSDELKSCKWILNEQSRQSTIPFELQRWGEGLCIGVLETKDCALESPNRNREVVSKDCGVTSIKRCCGVAETKQLGVFNCEAAKSFKVSALSLTLSSTQGIFLATQRRQGLSESHDKCCRLQVWQALATFLRLAGFCGILNTSSISPIVFCEEFALAFPKWSRVPKSRNGLEQLNFVY